ncbi:uncharacterized protein METZ01_LOCUS495352, partial [marine metagenome]
GAGHAFLRPQGQGRLGSLPQESHVRPEGTRLRRLAQESGPTEREKRRRLRVLGSSLLRLRVHQPAAMAPSPLRRPPQGSPPRGLGSRRPQRPGRGRVGRIRRHLRQGFPQGLRGRRQAPRSRRRCLRLGKAHVREPGMGHGLPRPPRHRSHRMVGRRPQAQPDPPAVRSPRPDPRRHARLRRHPLRRCPPQGSQRGRLRENPSLDAGPRRHGGKPPLCLPPRSRRHSPRPPQPFRL